MTTLVFLSKRLVVLVFVVKSYFSYYNKFLNIYLINFDELIIYLMPFDNFVSVDYLKLFITLLYIIQVVFYLFVMYTLRLSYKADNGLNIFYFLMIIHGIFDICK